MLRLIGRLLLLALLPAAASAHHGVAAYDMRTVLTAEGVVDAWTWQNPHTALTLRVGDRAERFHIEGAPPRWMEGQGWTPESLAAGEAVTVTYHPRGATAAPIPRSSWKCAARAARCSR